MSRKVIRTIWKEVIASPCGFPHTTRKCSHCLNTGDHDYRRNGHIITTKMVIERQGIE